MKIVLKRIYDAASPSDGYRVLIDRLWPRGITKEKAHLSEWNKNLALQKNFGSGITTIQLCGMTSRKNIEQN